MLSGGAKALIGAAIAGAALLFAVPQAGAQGRSDLFGFAGTPWQVETKVTSLPCCTSETTSCLMASM